LLFFLVFTGLKSVVNMCRSYGTFSIEVKIFCVVLSNHRIKIRC